MFSSRLFRDPFFSSGFDDMMRDDPFLGRGLNRPSIFENDPFFNPPRSNTTVEEEHKNDTGKVSNSSTGTSQVNQDQTKATPSTGGVTSASPQQQHLSHPRSYRGWMNPYDVWGFGGMDRMMDRMNRLMASEQNWPMDVDSLGGDSSSYTCSSSSYSHTGADGKPLVSHETRTERRRVGDVVEEQIQYRDSSGNERITSKRGIGNQLREVITDRNASGQERKVQNLKGIQPEEVDKFDLKWKEAAEKFDPQHKFLIRSGGQQETLKAGQGQAQLKSGTEQQAGVKPAVADQTKEKHEKNTDIRKSSSHQTTA